MPEYYAVSCIPDTLYIEVAIKLRILTVMQTNNTGMSLPARIGLKLKNVMTSAEVNMDMIIPMAVPSCPAGAHDYDLDIHTHSH